MSYKSILIEMTLKLAKSRKTKKKTRTKVCDLTKTSKS